MDPEQQQAPEQGNGQDSKEDTPDVEEAGNDGTTETAGIFDEPHEPGD